MIPSTYWRPCPNRPEPPSRCSRSGSFRTRDVAGDALPTGHAPTTRPSGGVVARKTSQASCCVVPALRCWVSSGLCANLVRARLAFGAHSLGTLGGGVLDLLDGRGGGVADAGGDVLTDRLGLVEERLPLVLGEVDDVTGGYRLRGRDQRRDHESRAEGDQACGQGGALDLVLGSAHRARSRVRDGACAVRGRRAQAAGGAHDLVASRTQTSAGGLLATLDDRCRADPVLQCVNVRRW